MDLMMWVKTLLPVWIEEAEKEFEKNGINLKNEDVLANFSLSCKGKTYSVDRIFSKDLDSYLKPITVAETVGFNEWVENTKKIMESLDILREDLNNLN